MNNNKKEIKVRLDQQQINELKVRMKESTYNKAIQKSLDFTLRYYDRQIKNEAMTIIDVTISNSIQIQLQAVYEAIDKMDRLQALFRKNHGIIIRQLQLLIDRENYYPGDPLLDDYD